MFSGPLIFCGCCSLPTDTKLHRLSSLDVGGEIDLVWELGDVDLEPLLHVVQGLRVRLVGNEGDAQTLGTEPGQIVGIKTLHKYIKIIGFNKFDITK